MNRDIQERFDRFVSKYIIEGNILKYGELSYNEFIDVCVYISACEGYLPCKIGRSSVSTDVLFTMKSATTTNIKNKWGKEFLDQYKDVSKYGRDLLSSCSLYQLYVPYNMFIPVIEHKYVIKTMLSIIAKNCTKYSNVIEYLIKDNRVYMNDSFVIDFSEVILKNLYENSGKVNMGNIVKGMYAYEGNIFDFYSEVN